MTTAPFGAASQGSVASQKTPIPPNPGNNRAAAISSHQPFQGVACQPAAVGNSAYTRVQQEPVAELMSNRELASACAEVVT